MRSQRPWGLQIVLVRPLSWLVFRSRAAVAGGLGPARSGLCAGAVEAVPRSWESCGARPGVHLPLRLAGRKEVFPPSFPRPPPHPHCLPQQTPFSGCSEHRFDPVKASRNRERSLLSSTSYGVQRPQKKVTGNCTFGGGTDECQGGGGGLRAEGAFHRIGGKVPQQRPHPASQPIFDEKCM